MLVRSYGLFWRNEEIEWSQSDAGLELTMPSAAPDEMAVSFRIIKQF